MRQQSLADNVFEKFRKKTRKEQFLKDMETIIPWQELTSAKSLLPMKLPSANSAI